MLKKNLLDLQVNTYYILHSWRKDTKKIICQLYLDNYG